ALVGSLTGLTEGAHFPVAADARYADDLNDASALHKANTPRRVPGNAAQVISSNSARHSIDIYAASGSPVVAVNDGVIKKLGESPTLGKFIVLQDAYGNDYTYAHLGDISPTHPVARSSHLSPSAFKLQTPDDATPKTAASAGDNATHASSSSGVSPENARQRLFPLPHRSGNAGQSSVSGQLDQLLGRSVPGYETFKSALSSSVQFDSNTMQMKPLKKGSKVTGGTR